MSKYDRNPRDIIKVTSTSESGSVKEYKINVNKDLKSSARGSANSLLVGIIGFALVLFTMFITNLLLNKMKSKMVAVATAGSVPSVKEPVKVSAPAPTTKTDVTPAPAPKPAPAAKPVMLEADVSQPVSKTANVIPDNK